MKLPVYMDYHATTPVDPRVKDVMVPFLSADFGNASSKNHTHGLQAGNAVMVARRQVAQLVHAPEKDILFTSGATESNNLALKGVAEIYREKGNHIITSVIEHKSVLDTCEWLEGQGFRVTYLPVGQDGLIDVGQVETAITDQTVLVSLALANNEVGVIQPLEEIGSVTRARGILLHTDATQAVGKIPVDVEKYHIDLMSMSAHKMYGPKGVGALFVRSKNPRVRIAPQMHGGGQERGLRSGTMNVSGIVGFGKACELAVQEMESEFHRVKDLRDRLLEGITSQLDEVYLNGHATRRLPNNLNLSFAYVEGESLLMSLGEEIAVASGSACASSNALEPSHVLKALGVQEALLHTAIRFGLGRFNTEEEVEYVVRRVVETVRQIRELSPLYEMTKAGNNSHQTS